jgi:hypothetical protein
MVRFPGDEELPLLGKELPTRAAAILEIPEQSTKHRMKQLKNNDEDIATRPGNGDGFSINRQSVIQSSSSQLYFSLFFVF